ncbi:CW-type Zinc Finger, putative [Leishmania donovani]|uniref:CW-type Zinc Finger, putative n=1 Tax=Leishmania donovani TaxID=5661 RepID=A0A3S7X6I4_LEIDO|nr:CW-type Zinc Finger, putative [Leishmania donovani]
MKSASPGPDRSPAASLSNASTPAVAGSTAGTSRPSASHEIQTEPRYIRLPDALYALRRRYPSVTESVFLECTRCHQWVAVPVLREIPNEIATAAVSRSALGLDSISVRTGYSGPLHHTHQDALRRREELANDAAVPQWRSRRLQEKHSHLSRGDANHNGEAHGDVSRAATATPQQAFFESILQHLRCSRRPSQEGAEDSAMEASESARQRSRRHTPLYIPNPDTFICAGWQCAWDADALADLRRDWLQTIYRALPMPPVCEESMALSSGASSSSPSLPTSPAVSFVEALRQRKAALNETLALELDVGRSRRWGRGVGQRAGRSEHNLEIQDSLPALSLPGCAAESETELSRMQGSWVRAAALHLLRNSGSAAEGCLVTPVAGDDEEAETPHHRHSSVEEDSQENVLSAYCWAVCDACGKLRRVAQPFPGGAPFVCAMAVTTSSSCRAARGSNAPHCEAAPGLDQACTVSEVEGLLQCNMKLCEAELIYAALSSPFLPYPLRAQLSALGRRQTCFKDPPEPAKRLSRADVSRVLLSEPLLRTIQSSVRESVTKGDFHPTAYQRRRGSGAAATATPAPVKPRCKASTSELDDADAQLAEEELFLYRSLPILRELARSIKARSISAFVRQLQLTPAQIQAKREAVMLTSFLSNHQHTPTTGSDSGTEKRKPAAVIATTSEAERTSAEVKVEEGDTSSTEPAERLPPRPTRTRTRAPPAVQENAPAPAVVKKEPMKMQAASGSDIATPQPVGEPTPAWTRGKPPQEAGPRASERQEGLAYEAAPQQPALGAPRKRGRTPRQRPGEPSRPVVPGSQATAEATGVVTGVGTASLRRRRQRCENVPVKEAKTAKSSVATAGKAETVGNVARSPASPRRGRPHGRPPGSGSARRKRSQGAHDEDAEAKAENGNKWEVVHWVQCDLCSKWRIVPHRVPAKVKFWECKMRYDEQRGRATTCDDPDDAELAA